MKLFKNINDYELLYYIEEGIEVALKMMFDKYEYLINAKIKRINLEIDHDEFFLEGYTMLYKAINTYNPDFGKSFMRYFEFILDNKYKNMIKEFGYKTKLFNQLTYLEKMEVDENINFIYDCKEIYNKMNDGFEKIVYENIYLNNRSINEVSRLLNCDVKKIYNVLYSIKNKIKEYGIKNNL